MSSSDLNIPLNNVSGYEKLKTCLRLGDGLDTYISALSAALGWFAAIDHGILLHYMEVTDRECNQSLKSITSYSL